MIIDIQILFKDVRTMEIVAIMVLTATLTKWLAAVVMTLTSRGDRDSCMLMFGLTNAHAAGALAICKAWMLTAALKESANAHPTIIWE